MASILIFKGRSQYCVTDRFIQDMAAGFEADGYRPVIVATHQSLEDQHKQLLGLIEQDKPIFALGFNAIGQFHCQERSIYEVTDIPFFGYLMDHPIYHMERIEAAPVAHSYFGCVDQRHLDFFHVGFHQPPPSVFLPHGGSIGQHAGNSLAERPIDVLFSGSGGNPQTIEARWKKLPDAEITDILFYGVESAKAQRPIPVLELVTRIFEEWNLRPNRELFIALMLEIENYLRVWRRLEVLRAFDDARVAVDIFGNGWDAIDFSCHRIHPQQSYDAIIDLMGKAKTVLNISHMFTSGGHDRVFSAMLNGAVAITNRSEYFEQILVDNAHYLPCTQAREFASRTADLLQSPQQRAGISISARETALRAHTWEQRATALHMFFASSDFSVPAAASF